MNTKKWWESKAVWIAVLQGVAGVLAAILSTDPALKGVGYLAIVKSVIDYFVRVNTTASIE